MSPNVVLLLLRITGALILLIFLGLIAWFIVQDIRVTTSMMKELRSSRGSLTVVESAVPAAIGGIFPLLPVTSIGRSPGNTLVVDDDFASGEHLLINLRDGRWWLEDLGSRNGTELNNISIDSATVLTAGDVITVGRTKIRVDF